MFSSARVKKKLPPPQKKKKKLPSPPPPPPPQKKKKHYTLTRKSSMLELSADKFLNKTGLLTVDTRIIKVTIYNSTLLSRNQILR